MKVAWYTETFTVSCRFLNCKCADLTTVIYTYARNLGASLGPFAQVVTSVVPRARETAIAMGFAVDYELVTLASDEELHDEANRSRWWEATHPFSALAQLMAANGATWRYGHVLVALWRDMLLAIPDGTAALVIGLARVRAHASDLRATLRRLNCYAVTWISPGMATSAAQPAVATDRFAREIVRFLIDLLWRARGS